MSSIEKAIERLKSQGDGEKQRVSTEYIVDHVVNDYIKENNNSNYEITRPDNEKPSEKKILNIDTERLKQLGYICPDDMTSQIAEEYRNIKRPLLKNAFGKGAVPIDYGNLIVVSSAVPGEGKTFTALNLAISISMERNTTILLVDTDVTNPSLSRIFQLEKQLGLLDVLSDKNINIGDIIHKTNIPTLSVIPAGHNNPYAAELLSSNRMHQFVHEIVQRYTDRIILFDAPPILATSHASVLAQIAGQIMIVVEAGKTLQSTIKEAVSKIDSNKVIGMILNKSRNVFKGRYYGYYGSYGHGSVAKADEIKK